jgi:hypothetical protein
VAKIISIQRLLRSQPVIVPTPAYGPSDTGSGAIIGTPQTAAVQSGSGWLSCSPDGPPRFFGPQLAGAMFVALVLTQAPAPANAAASVGPDQPRIVPTTRPHEYVSLVVAPLGSAQFVGPDSGVRFGPPRPTEWSSFVELPERPLAGTAIGPDRGVPFGLPRPTEWTSLVGSPQPPLGTFVGPVSGVWFPAPRPTEWTAFVELPNRPLAAVAVGPDRGFWPPISKGELSPPFPIVQPPAPALSWAPAYPDRSAKDYTSKPTEWISWISVTQTPASAAGGYVVVVRPDQRALAPVELRVLVVAPDRRTFAPIDIRTFTLPPDRRTFNAGFFV